MATAIPHFPTTSRTRVLMIPGGPPVFRVTEIPSKILPMVWPFRETIAENLLRMKAWNVFFATIIAIGVVYNTARVSLSERARDLATPDQRGHVGHRL